MTYSLIALAVALILLLMYFFLRKKPKRIENSYEEHVPVNRREHFRLKFNSTYCDFQPLISPSKHLGVIQDLSAGGIRIETSTDDLARGSLLMLYFEVQDETFIFEGIVRRKRTIAPNLHQYGIKFVHSTVAQQDRLYRKLRLVERQKSV